MKATSVIALLTACFALSGCVYERVAGATKAQTALVGTSKEEILACMGPPHGKAAEGSTEVWSYASGGAAMTTGAGGFGGTANSVRDPVGRTTTFGGGFLSAFQTEQLGCIVNVVMREDRVTAVRYVGNTGIGLGKGEQCYYAVENCLPK